MGIGVGGDGGSTQAPPPATKPKWKKYVAIGAGIVLAGLVQQGYINQSVLDAIVNALAGVGLAQ